MTLSDAEQIMGDSGIKTIRRVLEESFWYRLAYHGFREFGGEGINFHPSIEEVSGLFTVTCGRLGEDPIFRMVIPRGKVKSLLVAFKEFLPNQHGLSIHPIPLKSIFKISATTELDLEVLYVGGDNIDPFDSTQAPPFRMGKNAPLRINPEPSTRTLPEGEAPAFRLGSRRVDF